jgi:hypothetical protein
MPALKHSTLPANRPPSARPSQKSKGDNMIKCLSCQHPEHHGECGYALTEETWSNGMFGKMTVEVDHQTCVICDRPLSYMKGIGWVLPGV